MKGYNNHINTVPPSGSFAYAGVFESSTFNQATTAFNDALLSAGFGGTGNDEEKPFAYLNYMLFNDDDMTSEDSGWIQVPEAAGFDVGQLGQHAKGAFEAPIVAQQSGYIYIWVSNESEGAKVWFDDLKVTHTQTLVTQATDYGVWGDVLREMKAAEITYRHGYQGQFAEKDDETGWNHFELREYDPVIGRWTVIDPARQYWSPYKAMGNNPINSFDKDGAFGTWLGAWVYSLFRKGSDVLYNEDVGEWQVNWNDGSMIDIGGQMVPGFASAFDWGLDINFRSKTDLSFGVQFGEHVSGFEGLDLILVNVNLGTLDMGWNYKSNSGFSGQYIELKDFTGEVNFLKIAAELPGGGLEFGRNMNYKSRRMDSDKKDYFGVHFGAPLVNANAELTKEGWKNSIGGSAGARFIVGIDSKYSLNFN